MYKLSEAVERKFIDSIDLDDEWEIETDTGWEDITHIHETVEYEEWELILSNGLKLVCADTHIVFDENMEEIFVKDVKIGSKIQTDEGIISVKEVRKTSKKSNMFDVTVNSENHRYYTNHILSHNTTTAVAVILHYILFNEYKTVAILANKGDSAMEVLSRVKLAYEALPAWLQQGVEEWNKTYITLENGCRIYAGTTSSSAIRGKSCLTGNTRVCIEDGDDYYFVEIEKIINKANSSK